MAARLRHLWLAVRTFPILIVSAPRRALFREMQIFARALADALKAPLPQALAGLTPAHRDAASGASMGFVSGNFGGRDFVGVDFVGVDFIRDLADLTALLDRRSPLGLCLRRSLVRYHFLRRAGLPVDLKFGAKFVAGQPDREVTGHAWLTLGDVPYYEADENWKGFVVMLSFPQN